MAKRHGVSEQSIYGWRKRFGEMDVSDVKNLKTLEQENARLKKLLAERDLEIEVMKEISLKKWRAQRRVEFLRLTQLSEALRSDAPVR